MPGSAVTIMLDHSQLVTMRHFTQPTIAIAAAIRSAIVMGPKTITKLTIRSPRRMALFPRDVQRYG
jgi:hypothetical protein